MIARLRAAALPVALWVLIGLGAAQAQQTRPPGFAVASATPQATAAGIEIMQAGGNAFDAAVAVSAALAVTEPQSSGLGGGGFWLLHIAEADRDVMVDGRERAPGGASEDMYLDETGAYVREKSRDGPLAAGIPGEPAALVHLAETYGELPLAESLAPAIRLAREGFEVDPRLHQLLAFRADVIRRFEAAANTFLNAEGGPLAEDATLRQPELADTLERLAQQGRAGFYQGETAERLVEGVQAAGGIWTLADLRDYAVVEREPIRTRYQNFTIVSGSPPSSGGVVIAEVLNILAGFPWDKLSRVDRKHVMVEAWRRAYRDRATYLGDPDFVDMPIDRLADPTYAAGLRTSIRLDRATDSDVLAPPDAEFADGADTTHFSIIDGAGNRVAATLSINFPFGSGFMPAGTGVVLNNEMDDFSAKPLTPNAYGLLGTGANAIAPGKRPLSSMSPTFVVGPERTAVLGTPGGSRIITMVMLGILEFAGGADAQSIVGLPRFHHQYQPDRILYEPGALRESEKTKLRDRGHKLELSEREYGNMQVVIWDRDGNSLDAAADPRGVGSARIEHPKPPAGGPRNNR